MIPENLMGTKSKFEEWWSNMQLHMLGYDKLPEKGKIVAILTLDASKGEAASWAQVKREEVVNNK